LLLVVVVVLCQARSSNPLLQLLAIGLLTNPPRWLLLLLLWRHVMHLVASAA
jgi:hypothetical protein